jgi:hypothetical protein
MTRIFPVFLLSVFLFFSCNSDEAMNGQDIDPDTIYFDYKVWGEEGSEDITVMLQYRFGGPAGTTLTLHNPFSVEFDERQVHPDSSKLTGNFYEVIVPVNEFLGKHSIVFTDINKKQYKEEFEFQPFSLLTPIPEVVQRGDMVIQFQGLTDGDKMRILLSDTSMGDGVNRIEYVRNGEVIVTRDDLDMLVNGPIYLELYKEVERPVRNGTAEGGKFSLTYGLRREFELKD